jgi:hypothetical protein
MKQCFCNNSLLNIGKNQILCHFITTMKEILDFPITMIFNDLFEYIVIRIN